jgi:hypothetical protein
MEYRLKVLKLRYFIDASRATSVFVRDGFPDESFQFFGPSIGLKSGGDVLQVSLLAAKSDDLADPVGSLPIPPFPLRFNEILSVKLIESIPFQIQHAENGRLNPAFDSREFLKAVLIHPQRALEYFKE